jgi:DNA-binding MarR family transcriptional regulator
VVKKKNVVTEPKLTSVVAPDAPMSELAAFLISINRITNRLQSTAALSGDLTVSDWLLLRAYCDHKPESVADLARKVGVSRQRVHKQVAALQAEGLVTVSARELSLTKAGNQFLETVETDLLKSLQEGSEGRIHAARMSALRLARGFVPKEKIDGAEL